MKNFNAFILAAGLGERLRPITNHIPKPLVPLLGKPILERVLERVFSLPVQKTGVNLHYKREEIEQWISSSPYSQNVALFPEETILGTGGALWNAKGFLSELPFLLHNSDIISDMNLEELLRRHFDSGNLVTLAVHDYPEFNTVAINDDGLLRGVGIIDKDDIGKSKLMAYTGISVYEPEFLKLLPEGASSLVDGWLHAVEKGYRVGTVDVSGCYWSDIGTPARYAETVFEMLRREGEMIYAHASIKGCGDMEASGYVIVEENALLGRGAVLKNSVLLPGGRAEDGGLYEGCILGRDFIIKTEMPEAAGEGPVLIGRGGSDRSYYRIKSGERTSVLMQCGEDDPDFERHIEFSLFFRKYSIPTPWLESHDPEKKTAVFEDLGDASLYNWLRCPRDEKAEEGIYRKALDMLILLHVDATLNMMDCPILGERIFDYGHFRWETEYFMERFIRGVRGMSNLHSPLLEREFEHLASVCDSFVKTVMHRDFQSQNIMITKNGELKMIDFQGARMGPSAYDVVSILWDPYHRLSESLRGRLFRYYVEKAGKKGKKTFGIKGFIKSIPYCRLQRHMQALGAYAFLSSVKEKKYFLKHVPEGVRLLKEDIEPLKEELPALYQLISRL